MRLINATTLQFKEFEDEAPPYAILSHTWGHEEVSFQDFRGPPPTHARGYAKITWTCRQALKDGLAYVWVDTCCIDKSSSAELSEAINSMYRWYQHAAVCYAYLADVVLIPDFDGQAAALSQSRWFSRGWTLQELLAPSKLRFYSADWSHIGEREVFVDAIHRRTGIDPNYLSSAGPGTGDRIHSASIAERMSWASDRRTTRREDIAYCMLGILGVNLPLLYGEGETAFIRLQEEIIKHSDDQTIFAWDMPDVGISGPPSENVLYGSRAYQGVFAKSPASFARRGNLIPRGGGVVGSHFAATNKGVKIKARLAKMHPSGRYLMLLCGPRDDPTAMIAVPVQKLQDNQYARAPIPLFFLPYDEWALWRRRSVYLLVRDTPAAQARASANGAIWIRRIPQECRLGDALPSGTWSAQNTILDVVVGGIEHIKLHDSVPSVALRLPDGNEEQGCDQNIVKISFHRVSLPHFLCLAFRMAPFHVACAAISASDRRGEAIRPAEIIRENRRTLASHLLLPGGLFLHVDTSYVHILDKWFFVVDINISKEPPGPWELLHRQLAACPGYLLSSPGLLYWTVAFFSSGVLPMSKLSFIPNLLPTTTASFNRIIYVLARSYVPLLFTVFTSLAFKSIMAVCKSVSICSQVITLDGHLTLGFKPVLSLFLGSIYNALFVRNGNFGDWAITMFIFYMCLRLWRHGLVLTPGLILAAFLPTVIFLIIKDWQAGSNWSYAAWVSILGLCTWWAIWNGRRVRALPAHGYSINRRASEAIIATDRGYLGVTSKLGNMPPVGRPSGEA